MIFQSIEGYTAEFRQSLYNASSKSKSGNEFSKLKYEVQEYHLLMIDMVRNSCKELAK